MNASYQITTESDNIVIKLPRKTTNRESLERLLDYLEIESIRMRSEMSEEQARELAEMVKQGA